MATDDALHATDALIRLRGLLARRVLARADRDRRGGAGRHGLTTAQHLALDALAQAGPLGPSDLASHQGVAISTATRMLAGLERAGMVVPCADPAADRRRKRMEITTAGRDALAGADRTLRERISQVVNAATPHEQRVLAEAADVLTDLIGRAAPPPGD